MAVLTDYNTGRKYWNKLKQRLTEEGSELVTHCHQLKMKSLKDGKRYKTDVATTQQLYRIIRSIPSPKAEPFKLWLAQVAGIARKALEERTGMPVITSQNAAQLKAVVTNMIEDVAVKCDEDK